MDRVLKDCNFYGTLMETIHSLSFLEGQNMARRKTSKSLVNSLNGFEVVGVRSSSKIRKVSALGKLRNKEFIFTVLLECLIAEDLLTFQKVLRAHVDAVCKMDLARKSKISRRTLYRMLSSRGNPTLKSVSKVLHALYA